MNEPTAVYLQVDHEGWLRLPGEFDGIDALVAEKAGEFYHDECDGWERDWPVVIELMQPGIDAEYIHRYRVEREQRPEFSAREVSE